MLLSVVVPMFNEREVILKTHERLSSVLSGMDCDYEIIYIDDGSKDGTYELVHAAVNGDAHVRLIGFARNFGHQMAVRAGLKRASGETIVIIDADLQDPPEIIPGMLSKWREGYEVVYGKRRSRSGETFFKKFTAFAFYRILKALAGVDIPPDTGDFRLIDKKVSEAILSMNEHGTFLRGMVSWVGFKQFPYEFERQERAAGVTKYTMKKMLKLAFDGIYSFSMAPIALLAALGGVFCAAGLIYLLLALILSLGAVHAGIAVLVGMTGVLLLGMYVLGQYTGRIYEEAMNRPLYIVSRTHGFDREDNK